MAYNLKYSRGYPWFRIVSVCEIIDNRIIETYYIPSNNKGIDSWRDAFFWFYTQHEAEDKCWSLNAWWEKDYRCDEREL